MNLRLEVPGRMVLVKGRHIRFFMRMIVRLAAVPVFVPVFVPVGVRVGMVGRRHFRGRAA